MPTVLVYPHVALCSCSSGELCLFDLIPGLNQHVLIQTVSYFLFTMMLSLNLFFKLWPPSSPARPPVDPTSALSVSMLFSLPLLRASYFGCCYILEIALALEPAGHLDEIWAWTCLQYKRPSIEANQTSVDNVPYCYRAPFGAHRGGSTLWRSHLEPFFYLPMYLISLFFSLSSRFLPLGALTLSSL
ncbi:hypothetical protein C8R45DRAFT_1007392 [Mycena sanguinolenta]|nr:hypothetical protein C8R45DRAFT_1007392 [Mycena sanguinolenta]